MNKSKITIDTAIQRSLQSNTSASEFLASLPPLVGDSFKDWIQEQANNTGLPKHIVYGLMGQAFEVGYRLREIIDSNE